MNLGRALALLSVNFQGSRIIPTVVPIVEHDHITTGECSFCGKTCTTETLQHEPLHGRCARERAGTHA